jgi:predicted phosphohydrolase
MNVWAISDLHLSFGKPERRDRFGARWRDHAARVEQAWREAVRPGDIVLLPGDLSTARNHREVQPDLEWLGSLPGIKVLAPGNHDRWWNGAEAVRKILRRRMIAVDGDAAEVEGVVVCGTRGVPAPRGEPGDADHLAVENELNALNRALEQASQLLGDRDGPLYVLRHFPPFDAHGTAGPWVERFERARVTACVYGHLHIQAQWALAVQGSVRCVRYYCVAADAIGFRPLKIDGSARPSATHIGRFGTHS